MDGVLSQKSVSKTLLNSLARWELILLVSCGALAVVLHQTFRAPLNLPGRHGIEWMALLILGRALSQRRYAGSLASVGAAATSMLPIWGFDDPFMPLIYLLPGLVMDLAFWMLPKLQGKLAFLILLGGLAHATKPLARWVIALTSGWAYGSLFYGVAYPVGSHILFGLIGGFLGAAIALGSQKLASKL